MGYKVLVSLLTLLPGIGVYSNLQAASAMTAEAEWAETIAAAEQEGELSYYSLGKIGFVGEFEWMDSEPMQRVVTQALAKSGRKP